MRILLCCSAGMSTSLLVTKMQAAAKAQGAEHQIWAASIEDIENEIQNADIVLMAPQVRYLHEQYKSRFSQPIKLIDMVSYGRCDGAAVLKHALAN